MSRKPLLICALFLLAGCAQHEYQLLSPHQTPNIIAPKQRLHVSIPPLNYSFSAYQDHLIVWIANPTDQVIQLLGNESFAVSPDGQSRSLRSRAIGSHSFIKLIFPPVVPAPRPSGPSITFGASYSTGRAPPLTAWPSDDPYYYPYGASSDLWQWHDGQQMRLELVFQQRKHKFSQKFIFQQRHI